MQQRPDSAQRPDFVGRKDGVRLACLKREGEGPCVVWLGGFRSDMRGTKAQALDDWAHAHGRACLRLDYSGHGESGGAFEDGTIGVWLNDAMQVIDARAPGPLVLVGSSMGGWIAALIALRRPERIAGIVFVAPAPDFTQELMWPQMSEATRETLLREGRIEEPSEYSPEPHVITRALIEDGRAHLVLDAPIPVSGPVRILQGMADPDVPWAHALRLVERLRSPDVTLTLVKDGDHRLSTPSDIARLLAAVEDVCAASA